MPEANTASWMSDRGKKKKRQITMHSYMVICILTIARAPCPWQKALVIFIPGVWPSTHKNTILTVPSVLLLFVRGPLEMVNATFQLKKKGKLEEKGKKGNMIEEMTVPEGTNIRFCLAP